MRNKWFIKDIYMGSDGSDFIIDFSKYLKDIYDNMTDSTSFTRGAKTMLKEILEEMGSNFDE